MANSGIGTLFKWSVMILVVMMLLVGGWYSLRLSQFQTMTEQLKDDGYPVSMSELQHDVDEGQIDALPLMLRVKPLLRQFGKELNDLSVKFGASGGISCSGHEFASFDETEVVELQLLLQRHEELSQFVDEILDADDVTVKTTPVLNGSVKRGEDDFGFLVMELIELGQFSLMRSRILNESGNGEGAVANGLKTIQFAELISERNDGWFSCSYAAFLAHCGMQAVYEAISRHPVSDASFDEINRVIDHFDVFRYWNQAAIADRATAIEHLLDQGIQHAAINGVCVLKFYADAAEKMQQEVFEYGYEKVEYTAWEHGPWLVSQGQVFDIGLIPNQIAQLAELRGLRIIAALIQHEVSAEEFEGAADKQARLVSLGVPEEMTRDTCTGDLMQVKFVNGMWRAYSVGLDGNDDGGVLVADPGLVWLPESELGED